MSKGTLGQVVKRAIGDAAFRRQLQSDPAGALKGFDLTGDERAALRSSDASKLSALGVDQRMSKIFATGAAASAPSKLGSGNDISMGMAVPDGGEPLVQDAILDNAEGSTRSALDDQQGLIRNARISDAGGAVRSALDDQTNLARAGITSEATGVRTALGDQHDGGRAAIGDNAGGAGRTALDDQQNLIRNARISDAGGAVRSDLTSEGTGVRNALGDQHDGGRAALGDNATANWSAAPIDGGPEGSAADASSLASSDSAATSAFLTADELGNDVVASGTGEAGLNARVVDSADLQREALDAGAAMANPEGYDQPDPNAA